MEKKNGRVTIKSIANELGISFSTVAKALNNDPCIRQETRELVQNKAKEMNYTRNYFAQGLRQKGSKTVAIILNEIDIGCVVCVYRCNAATAIAAAKQRIVAYRCCGVTVPNSAQRSRRGTCQGCVVCINNIRASAATIAAGKQRIVANRCCSKFSTSYA